MPNAVSDHLVPAASDESPTSNLRIRVDFEHPRMIRTEESLRSLRQRIERQLDQEDQLHRLYQGWQQSWTHQCEQMQRQVAKLEAYLAAWCPREDAGCRLTVVEEE